MDINKHIKFYLWETEPIIWQATKSTMSVHDIKWFRGTCAHQNIY
jgi:hypothetical protein